MPQGNSGQPLPPAGQRPCSADDALAGTDQVDRNPLLHSDQVRWPVSLSTDHVVLGFCVALVAHQLLAGLVLT